MIKKSLLYALIPFVILTISMIILSTEDLRGVDRQITLGYPMSFYINDDGRFCSNPDNADLEICKYPKIDYSNLIIDLAIIYLISIIATLLFFKLKK